MQQKQSPTTTVVHDTGEDGQATCQALDLVGRVGSPSLKFAIVGSKHTAAKYKSVARCVFHVTSAEELSDAVQRLWDYSNQEQVIPHAKLIVFDGVRREWMKESKIFQEMFYDGRCLWISMIFVVPFLDPRWSLYIDHTYVLATDTEGTRQWRCVPEEDATQEKSMMIITQQGVQVEVES